MNVRTSGILVFLHAIALLTSCRFDLPPDKTLKLCESPKAISTVADAANTKKFTFSLTGTLTDIKGSITWNITGDDKSPDPAVAGAPGTTYTNVFSKGGSFTVTATGTTLCGEKINLTTTVTIKTCDKPSAITATPDAANPRKYTFALVGSTNDITQPIDWLVTGDTKAQDPTSTDTKTYSNTFSKGGTFTISATSTTTCGDKVNLSTTITVKTCEIPIEITATPDAANPGKYNFTLNGVLKDVTNTDWMILRDGNVMGGTVIGLTNPNLTFSYTTTNDGTYTASATITTQCSDKKTLTANFTVSIIASIANMMVSIPAGTFQMGDVFGEGDPHELPVHSVTLSAFKMSKYEVSQAQWQAVMGSNPSYFNTCPTCPVEQVSWDDIQVFLTKLNTLTGGSYRLPTEAEWEYAAREGGKKVRFGNGKDILDPAEANFDARTSYATSYSIAGEYRQKTTPVGSFIPNALGLHDMTGNLLEWCSDWYKGYPGSTGVSDFTGSFRVVRGSSWNYPPLLSRVAVRGGGGPSGRNRDLGFRVLCPQ